ncbi:MAG: PRC-barrel domain-containing protein [Actinomycetota bacterium]|nr:PRC-barrel domain-containing protein [Actinomycetota bacterium]
MLFSEAQGRKVVSIDAAATVGNIRGYIVDPAAAQIVALSLNKTPHSGNVLPFSDITGFGADAVTVAGDQLIVEPDERISQLDGKAHLIVGKQVLNTDGQRIGAVADVDFDAATGRINQLILAEESVPGTKLLGVGSYAVVVRA